MHYRDCAQAEEIAELDALDREIEDATEKRRRAVDRRNRLVNRLVKRAKLRARYSAPVSRETNSEAFT